MAFSDNLEVLYHFSGNLDDDSGNGNNGTNSGTVTTTDKNSVADQARLLDGANDSISMGYSLGNSDTSFTFAAWVQHADGSTVNEQIINSFNGGNQFVGIQGNASSAFSFTSRDSNGASIGSTITGGAVGTAWKHIAVVRDDAANTIAFYVDGVLIESKADTRVGNFNSGNIVIGKNGSLSNQFWDGKIDEVVIFSRALSGVEITKLFDDYDAAFNTGYANKVSGVVPGQVNSVDTADISKVNGV